MKPIKGLNKDASKRSQPEGTYRDAHNAVVNEELGALRREKGLQEKLDLGGFSIYGHILLDEGDFILFLRNGNVSEISRWDGSTLTNIVSDDINRTGGSDFSTPLDLREPVEATYRSLANGDDVIYWTDGVNPPRFLNIDAGLTGTNPSPDTLNIFPEISTNASFTLDEIVQFGGSLKAGAYYLAFAYVDADQSTTNYMLVEGPIDIPGAQGFGGSSDTSTRKAIRFTLNGLDTSYDQLRVALIKGTQVTLLPDLPINGSSLTSIVTGNEDGIDGSLNEVLIDRANYQSAKTLAQHDGTLYMGNLKQRQRKDLQQYVNNVDVECVPVKAPTYDGGPQDEFMTDPENDFLYRTYKRGEVYALYMSFLLDDGSETEAFHIPGRRSGSGEVQASFELPSLPNLSDSPSEGNFDVNTSIPSQGELAYGEPVSVTSDAGQDDSFDIVYYDDQGTQIKAPTVTVTSGDDEQAIVQACVDALNATSLFNTEWTATVVDLQNNGNYAIGMEANQTGSQYNGYYVHIENDAGGFSYSNGGPDPSDGLDDTSDAPDHTIDITWDDGQQSVSVTVSDLNGQDSPSTIASKYKSAIDTYGISYTTATSTSTLTITSNNPGKTYNADGVVQRPDIADETFTITGGWDNTSDKISVELDWGTGLTPVPCDVDINQTISQVIDDLLGFCNNWKSNYSTEYADIEFSSNSTTLFGKDTSGSSSRVGNVISFTTEVGVAAGWGVYKSNWSAVGDTQEISGSHPLAKYESDYGTLYEYHHSSNPDETLNMGYWENAEETYPDEDRWKVKDSSGAVVDDYRGDNVRHHRMPDMADEPYWEEIDDDMYLLGLRLKNVHVPSSELDIVGYRLHYAKKTPNNRLIIDQSTEIHGWLDAESNRRYGQQENEVFEDDVWSAHGWPAITDFDRDGVGHDWTPSNGGGLDMTLLQLHPFESLRRNISISGVTHVKLVGQLGYLDDKTCSLQMSDTLRGYNPAGQIRAVKGISYIDKGQRNVNLTNLGFSRDYDNLFGESKIVCELDNKLPDARNYLVDICQLQTNVHIPFESQELVSTGYTGDINQPTSDVIFGGDITISPWYYKAHTLLALAEKDESGGVNDRWAGFMEEISEIVKTIFSKVKDTIFGNSINNDKRDGSIRAMRELIGNTSGINHTPMAWGQLWYDLVESRDHPWRRTEGETQIETFHPSSQEWVASPDIDEIPQEFSDISSDQDQAYAKTKWIFQFFKQSDNWLEYNREYSRLSDIKPAFPYRATEITKTNFPTRIIRSAESNETGLRSSWRQFLVEDYADLPRNKGELVKIVPQQSNLIAHTEEALFRTRGREEIAVGDQRAYLGVGDIFSAPPQELINLEEGFGGLADPREGLITPFGYVFVDREAGKVYQIGKGPKELSNQGMRTWFRDNIDESTPIRMGVDPQHNRLLLTETAQGNTLSYMPGLDAWVSFHDFAPSYYLGNRSELYCEQGQNIYEIGAGEYGKYVEGYEDFSVTMALPAKQPDAQIPITLWIDALVFDGNEQPVETDIFDSVQITNSYQDTGVVTLRPRISENGRRNDYYNIRKTDRVWKINDLRDISNVPGQVDGTQQEWKYNRRLADTYQEIKLIYGSVRNRVVALYNLFLNQRPSRR